MHIIVGYNLTVKTLVFNMNSGLLNGVTLGGLRKALGTVNHETLMNKVYQYYINQSICQSVNQPINK